MILITEKILIAIKLLERLREPIDNGIRVLKDRHDQTNMQPNIKKKIKQILEKKLVGAKVSVEDPLQDQTHLQATVIYAKFSGMPLLEQHRLVMNTLKEHFATELHALSLKTRAE